jgi:hypothetical protein
MGPEFWDLHAGDFILTHSGAAVNGKKGLHAREKGAISGEYGIK